MEIIFIGTGSGKTSLKRHHTSFMINSSKNKILVDAGDAVSYALLKAGINFLEIDFIFLTHFHPDHFSGFASLLNQMKMNERKDELKVVLHQNLSDSLLNYLRINMIFPERLGFRLTLLNFNFSEQFILSDEVTFTAKENTHLQKLFNISDNYSNLLSSSFLMNCENIKIQYTGDIGGKEDLYLFEDELPDYLICECTHLSVSDIIKFYKEVNPKKLFLVHISDEKEIEIVNMIEELSGKEKENIIITEDQMKYFLEKTSTT